MSSSVYLASSDCVVCSFSLLLIFFSRNILRRPFGLNPALSRGDKHLGLFPGGPFWRRLIQSSPYGALRSGLFLSPFFHCPSSSQFFRLHYTGLISLASRSATGLIAPANANLEYSEIDFLFPFFLISVSGFRWAFGRLSSLSKMHRTSLSRLSREKEFTRSSILPDVELF